MKKIATLVSALLICAMFGVGQVAHAQGGTGGGGGTSVPPINIAGDWYGQMSEPFQGLVSDAMTLNEDTSGNLSGNLCIFDNVPQHCGGVTGKASATNFQFKGENIQFTGFIDPNLTAVCADGTTSIVIDGGIQFRGGTSSFNFTHCVTVSDFVTPSGV